MRYSNFKVREQCFFSLLQNSKKISKTRDQNIPILSEQDAREAMRVVFSVLTKRICMHKTKFLMNIFKYCFKNDIK